jgi:CPA1 family monovalent cation:H+ antiporter
LIESVQFLLVVLTALGVSGFASKRGLQPGVVVVLVATAVSFIPGIPRFEFSSHLILGAIMPPLLFSASRDFPVSRFATNSRSILGLGVILVIITTVIVGFVANLVLPALTLSGAFVLAAIVSPPDTITTVVHGREFGLTNRCVSILTGESIVNDAAALTLFTAATLAVTGSDARIENPALLFVYAAVVGLLVGALLGNFAGLMRLKMDNPSSESVIGIILPFAAYLTAEELHASGVLAVVMSGFTFAIHSIFNEQAHVSAATRVQESAIWPAIDILLESVVFAFIGLQAKYVLETLRHEATPVSEILMLTAIILALLVAIRMIWVFFLFSPGRRRASFDSARRRVVRRDAPKGSASQVSDKEAFLIGWTGMRGIVTIGAAASLPMTVANGGPFPAREEIQTVAYLVAITTLVVQASLLPVMARRCNLDLVADDREANREVAAALAIAAATPIPDEASAADRFEFRRVAVATAVRRNEITDFAARVVIQGLDLSEIAQSKRAAIFAANEDALPSPADE